MGEGNVDISKARRHSQRNIAKLAGYLSKYLSKTFDDGGEGDSYRASGKALPKPVVIRSLTQTLDDAGSDLLGLLFKFYNLNLPRLPRLWWCVRLDNALAGVSGGYPLMMTLDISPAPGVPASMVLFAGLLPPSATRLIRA